MKIEIKEDITRKLAKRVIQMLNLNPRKAITMEIDSDGGSYWDAVDIYNAMRSHTGTITTRVKGLAASSASLIFLGGKRREVETGSNVMMHQPWTPEGGNAKELRDKAAQLDDVSNHAVSLYAKFTNKSKKAIEALLDAETYLTGQQALNLGFATSVVKSGVKTMAYAKRRLKVVMKTQKQAVNVKTKKASKAKSGKKSGKKSPVKMQLTDEMKAAIGVMISEGITTAMTAAQEVRDKADKAGQKEAEVLAKKKAKKAKATAEVKMQQKTQKGIDNVVSQIVDLEKEPLTKAARKKAYVLMQKGKFDKKEFLKTADRVKAKMKLSKKGKVDHEAKFAELKGAEKTAYYKKHADVLG